MRGWGDERSFSCVVQVFWEASRVAASFLNSLRYERKIHTRYHSVKVCRSGRPAVGLVAGVACLHREWGGCCWVRVWGEVELLLLGQCQQAHGGCRILLRCCTGLQPKAH